MANPYGIHIDGADGIGIIDGEAILDPDPAAPGKIPQTLRVDTFRLTGGNTYSIVATGNVVGATPVTGEAAASLTTAPVAISALSAVCDLSAIIAEYVADLDPGSTIDMQVDVVVTDLTGTNVATSSGTVASGAPAGGPFTLTGDFSDLTWAIASGTDLTAADSVLSTTAGGVFVASIIVTLAAD